MVTLGYASDLLIGQEKLILAKHPRTRFPRAKRKLTDRPPFSKWRPPLILSHGRYFRVQTVQMVVSELINYDDCD